MIYIGIGSNLGDREAYIGRAVSMLGSVPGLEVVAVSANYETAPVGGPEDQGMYLNATASVESKVAPDALLGLLKSIERALGRDRNAERWGPRTLDLDILLMGDTVLDEPELTIPHPRMCERLFVLEPLCEIAADAVHPARHQTVRQLLAAWRAACES